MDAAVREWLGMIDGGNLGGAWDEMSELAKSLQSEGGWVAMLNASREPMGDVVNRERAGNGWRSRLGGVGKMLNYSYKYQTEFEHGRGLETVTLVIEESGDLRVMSYVIEPDTEKPSDSVSATDSANTFVELDLALAKAREMYLEGNLERVKVEGQWNTFIAAHPEFPDEKSRQIVTRKRIELLREIDDLAKDFGTGHPKIVEMKREMERLAGLPEMGEKQMERETTEKILAKGLPGTNRLEVRLVTPDDATAEIMTLAGNPSSEIQVRREVIVCDRFIAQMSFMPEYNGADKGTIQFKLDAVGTTRMAEATQMDQGRPRLAIFVDGKLESAPEVVTQLGSGFSLSGLRSHKEYEKLFKSLPIANGNINSLEAYRWLIDVDKEDFGACYAGTSAAVQKRFTEQEWAKIIGQVGGARGKNYDRAPGTYHEVSMMMGDRESSFRLFTFKSKFSPNLNVVETVSMVKEEDGSWKVDGYWVP